MAQSEARGVGPALFDRDWSRVSGSWQGLSKKAQMVRAARGYSPAIFKPIAKGECHTGAQLKAQLTDLSITYRPIGDLIPYARNARTGAVHTIRRKLVEIDQASA